MTDYDTDGARYMAFVAYGNNPTWEQLPEEAQEGWIRNFKAAKMYIRSNGGERSRLLEALSDAPS